MQMRCFCAGYFFQQRLLEVGGSVKEIDIINWIEKSWVVGQGVVDVYYA